MLLAFFASFLLSSSSIQAMAAVAAIQHQIFIFPLLAAPLGP
jgi:hypothetical protein